MELGQFVLLIDQSFGPFCSATQEGEWVRFQYNKLFGAVFVVFFFLYKELYTLKVPQKILSSTSCNLTDQHHQRH